MARIPDTDRVLLLLSDTSGLSNQRVQSELNLSDKQYKKVKGRLLNDGFIQKYACRGGGIRLTASGEDAVPQNGIPGESSVREEADLYDPLVKFLRKQAKEDGTRTIVCNVANQRVRGQWQNPDVVRITVDQFPRLRVKRVSLVTYEVKQYPKWNVGAVYEAASHHRFAHQAYVVLEWAKGIEFSLTDSSRKMDQISRECQRFGIGLATLEPYYKSYRLRTRLEANPTTPEDEAVEAWLDSLLSRNPETEAEFNRLVDEPLSTAE